MQEWGARHQEETMRLETETQFSEHGRAMGTIFKYLRRKAKRIIFCGYSFPDADIHLKYLLKRVEINKGKTPEIIIINNHNGKPDIQAKSEKERYERFFSSKERVHFTDRSFEQFCERDYMN